MTKITYTSDGDADEVEAFGVKFMDGKPVEVSDEVAAKLKGNRFFKAASDKATTDKAPATPAKVTKATDKAPGQPADADASFKAPFEAKDEENGWWTVYDADSKKVKALRKDDAEIFNSLSDDDKAKQVETFTTV
ncbi:hypothetical protein J5288_08500 [Agrobacterium sp. S2/73]|uniref:hypothetical protein n=1 Tax=unclassified Agrobacterium TaxID=2632611 RepID=UPI001ADC13D5|nr:MULTISPECIES: hypothetical protein [unclassified Agrobacterium]MBO9108741.1 hypothetical protein [Agrobacterium sp. S2/73]QXZ73501.1 hypothetical protein J5276_06010 [Agrobacterium sp. S7/73]